MNYNIVSYLIYLLITFYVTVVVGKICYTNGEHYLMKIINDKPELVRSINSILLIGYYLLNLGYATIMLSFWPQIESLNQLICELSTKTGKILLLLGFMHYFNILITALYSIKINKQSQF